MKLPRDRAVFFRPKNDRPPLCRAFGSFLDVAPARQNKTVARNRHAMAAQKKPNASLPNVAFCPPAINSLRPCTYSALQRVSRRILWQTLRLGNRLLTSSRQRQWSGKKEQLSTRCSIESYRSGCIAPVGPLGESRPKRTAQSGRKQTRSVTCSSSCCFRWEH